MAPKLRREDLLAFMGRDWSAVEGEKRAYWIERVRAEGPIAGLRASDMLREHVARFGIGDQETARSADLADLVELKRRIDAASTRLAR